MKSKQSLLPLVAMSSALLLLLTGTQWLTRTVSETAPKMQAVPTEAAYQTMADATEELNAGSESRASGLLDTVVSEALVVAGGASGPGALQTLSPTIILMRLGRTLSAHAVVTAQQGNKANALAWVGRCHDLSEQVVRTPTPTNEALLMARFLDNTADRAEIAVYTACGETQLAAQVTLRRGRMNRFWQQEMMARLKQKNGLAVAAKRSAKQAPGEDEQSAATMLHRYQRERSQARHDYFTPLPSPSLMNA